MTTPRKPRQEASKKPAPARPKVRAGLSPTDDPDVFLNEFGMAVDAQGISLGFKALKNREDKQAIEVLGHPVTTPAQYLKAVALDPRMPTGMRLDAAKAAAPYTDRKQPTAIDGGVDPKTGAVVPLFPQSFYDGLTDEEATTLAAIMEAKRARSV